MILFHGNNIAQAVPLVPTLLKCIERAVAQPAQSQLVSEGLCAACFILKILATGIDLDNLQSFWNVVLDVDKQLFLSEKYLSLASDDCKYASNHQLLL